MDDEELFGLDKEHKEVVEEPPKSEGVKIVPPGPGPLDTEDVDVTDPFGGISREPSVDPRPTQVDMPAFESEGWVDPNPTQVNIPVLDDRVERIRRDFDHLSPGSALISNLANFRGDTGEDVLRSMHHRIRQRNDGISNAYDSMAYIYQIEGETTREEVIGQIEDFIIYPLCKADINIQLRGSDASLERVVRDAVRNWDEVSEDRIVNGVYEDHKEACLEDVDKEDPYGKIVYGLFDELFAGSEKQNIGKVIRSTRIDEVKTLEGALKYVKGESEGEKLANIGRYAKRSAGMLSGLLGWNTEDVLVDGTPDYVVRLIDSRILIPMIELEKANKTIGNKRKERRLVDVIEGLEKSDRGYFGVVSEISQRLGIFKVEEDEEIRDARTAYIGDVHGAYDRFVELLDQINAERVVFLGDYIDRGEDSIRVVDHVVGMVERGEATAQVGNHDEMFMGAVEGSGPLMFQWLYNGGAEVLEQVNGEDERIDKAIAATYVYRDDPENDSNYSELMRCIDDLASYEVLWNHPKLKKMYDGLRIIAQSGGGSQNIDRVFSVHAGVGVDPKGRMSFRYKGLEGREAFESMQGDFAEGVFISDMSKVFEGVNENLGDESLPCDDHSPFFAADAKRAWDWFDRVNTPAKADALLEELDADVIVYGHSPVKPNSEERETDYGKRCRVHHDGKMIGVDFGMAGTYGSRGGALLIHDNGDASFVGFKSGNSHELEVLYKKEGLVKEPVQRDVEDEVVPTLAPEDEVLESPENLAEQLYDALGFSREEFDEDNRSLLSTLSAFKGNTGEEILDSLDSRVDGYHTTPYQDSGCYLQSTKDRSRIEKIEAKVVKPLADIMRYDFREDEDLIAAVRAQIEGEENINLVYVIDDSADKIIGPENEYNLIVRKIHNLKQGQMDPGPIIQDVERRVRAEMEDETPRVDEPAPTLAPVDEGEPEGIFGRYRRGIRDAASSAKDTVLGGLTGWGKERYRKRKADEAKGPRRDVNLMVPIERSDELAPTLAPEDEVIDEEPGQRYDGPEVLPADTPIDPNLADVLTQGSPVRGAIDEVLGVLRGEDQLPQGEVIEGDYQEVRPEPVAEPGRVKDAIPVEPVPKRAVPKKKKARRKVRHPVEPPLRRAPSRAEQRVPRHQTEVYVLETFGSIGEGYTDKRDIAMACFRTGRFVEGYEMLEGVSLVDQLYESRSFAAASENMRDKGLNHIANYYEALGKICDPYLNRDERRSVAEGVNVSIDMVAVEELNICLNNMRLIAADSKRDARDFYEGAKDVFGSERNDDVKLGVLRQKAEELELYVN